LLIIIILLQIIIIGFLYSINNKLPKRDYVKEALERDETIRQEKEKIKNSEL